ncbi:hypothetical protein BD779DRAFT_541726 [Infundibulicybe gibba]|nr:hypothetical protein BD779DRAFT_541726 [Infundibulicybe gibba]
MCLRLLHHCQVKPHTGQVVFRPPPPAFFVLKRPRLSTMPATAVYIAAVVGAVAAGYVFKEFVYEPHIAPKIERWAEEFLATRAARRRQRTEPIAVPLRDPSSQNESSHRRRTSTTDTDSHNEDSLNPFGSHNDSIELERLISSEVRDWRSEVDRSQSRRLRHRSNAAGTPSAVEVCNLDPTAIHFVK